MLTFDKPIQVGDKKVYGATEFSGNDAFGSFGSFENSEISSKDIDWSDTSYDKGICDMIKRVLAEEGIEYK